MSRMSKEDKIEAENNYNDMLHSIEANGWNIKHVPVDWQTKRMCALAIKTHGEIIKHVARKFQTLDFCYTALKKNKSAWKYISSKMKENILENHPEYLV